MVHTNLVALREVSKPTLYSYTKLRGQANGILVRLQNSPAGPEAAARSAQCRKCRGGPDSNGDMRLICAAWILKLLGELHYV